MPDGIQHAPYLSVTSLSEGQFDDPGSALLPAADQLRVCRGSHFALADGQAFGERFNSLFARLALDGRLIELAQALARVGHPVDKVAVVREKNQPFRIGIQSSGRNQPHSRYPDEIRDLLFRVLVRNG